eukprot:RCo023857
MRDGIKVNTRNGDRTERRKKTDTQKGYSFPGEGEAEPLSFHVSPLSTKCTVFPQATDQNTRSILSDAVVEWSKYFYFPHLLSKTPSAIPPLALSLSLQALVGGGNGVRELL